MGRLFLFVLGILAVLFVCVCEGLHPRELVHPGAAVVSILCPFLIGLAIYPSAFTSALSTAFKGRTTESTEVKKSMEVISCLRNSSLSMGGLGFISGTIGVFVALSEKVQMSPLFAFAALCVIYTVTLAELGLAPLMNRVAIRMLDQAQLNASDNAIDWTRAGRIDLFMCIIVGAGLVTFSEKLPNGSELHIPAYGPANILIIKAAKFPRQFIPRSPFAGQFKWIALGFVGKLHDRGNKRFAMRFEEPQILDAHRCAGSQIKLA